MIFKRKRENLKFLEEEKSALCAELETANPLEEDYAVLLKRIDEIDRIIREHDNIRVDIYDKAIRNGLTAAGLIVTLLIFEAGLEFEETGTPRSVFFKEARSILTRRKSL
jgi:hypothetical protein